MKSMKVMLSSLHLETAYTHMHKVVQTGLDSTGVTRQPWERGARREGREDNDFTIK